MDANKSKSGKRALLLCLLCLLAGLPAGAEPGEGGATLAERLISAYDAIDSIHCEVRRDWEGPAGRVRMNSRVHWRRPLRLHVENFAPLRRRYVCDGERLYYHIEGDRLGFARPVEDLDPEWRLRLDVVPGTAMEHLLPLRGVAETRLEETSNGIARRGYLLEQGYVVLHADDAGRMVLYERFAGRDAARPVARIAYSHFKEAAPGAWIPLRHEAAVIIDGTEREEITRITLIAVNAPEEPELFKPEPYFEGIEFVDSFEKIYGR